MVKKNRKKSLYTALRSTWSRSPVTQIKDNGKAYNRKNEKQNLHRLLTGKDSGGFAFP